MDQLIFVLEMIGTIAFAVSGVIAAKEKEMDLFGAIVLGCTTAVGGGMVYSSEKHRRLCLLSLFIRKLLSEPAFYRFTWRRSMEKSVRRT